MPNDALEERFAGPDLDREVWLPHYLPAWSSLDQTRASYRLDDGLRLTVPVDHPVWCPGDHTPPLRVSGLQTGSWSGPVGSTRGQLRFREGQEVREEQEHFEGWLIGSGRVEIRARMTLSPRSMAALWMSGFEDDDAQEQCGEICVFEIFGNALQSDPPSAEVGVGIKPFRDPALTDDFAAPRVPIDVTEPHTYAVRLGRQQGRLHRRRRGGTPLRRPADVPAPADARRLRLPGVVGRRRRPAGAGAGGRARARRSADDVRCSARPR